MGFAPGGFACVNTRLSGSWDFTENPFQDPVPAPWHGAHTLRLEGGLPGVRNELRHVWLLAKEPELSVKWPEGQGSTQS